MLHVCSGPLVLHTSSPYLFSIPLLHTSPPGVERLEIDMNPCHQAWGAKVEQLQRLTPALSRCKAHVSTAVPKMAFGANIRQLAAKLQSIEVRVEHMQLVH